jgi:Rad3-related DNA helicase
MSLISNIAPTDLGLPEKFGKWRTHQPAAIEQTVRAFKAGHKFVGGCMPAGSGKSPYYMAVGLLLDQPTLVLTATKGLQDQLLTDFSEELGLVDVRGRANYQCDQYPRASCEQAAGYCSLSGQPSCTYKAAYEQALGARFVVTNYAMALHNPGLCLGRLVVCDEAHRIEQELEGFLVVELRDREVRDVLGTLLFDLGDVHGEGLGDWSKWARRPASVLGEHLEELKRQLAKHRREQTQPGPELPAAYRRTRTLHQKLSTVAGLGQADWVVERGSEGVTFTPVEPGAYAHGRLFAGAARVLLTSATLTKADLKALRISDYAFHDYPCEFERKLCPVYAVPGVRLKHNSSAEELKQWVEVIDSIIESRGVGRNGGRPRKGLIDTVSYDRQQYLVRHSRFRELMLANSSWGGADGSEKAPVVVDEFRRAEAPCVLVSPSFSEGWDFPGLDCEWIIAAKVAFPDTRSRVMRERVRRDKLLLVRLALRKASQLARRGMRSEKDYCEVFFVDENIRWVYWRNRELAAGWFEVQGKQVLPVKGRGWRERFGQ